MFFWLLCVIASRWGYIKTNLKEDKTMPGNTYSSSIIKTAIAPLTGTDNTAFVSAIIDTAGYGYLEFDILTGILADADATATVLVEGGDDSGLSDNTAVADADMENTEVLAAFDFSDDSQVRKIAVKNLVYRYYRLTVTPASNTGSFPLAAVARLAGSNYEGITQPES